MSLITRRRFVANASTLAAGTVFAGISHTAFADPKPHIDFPTVARDRVAAASYPFRAYINALAIATAIPSCPAWT
jgi:hypothetical protein